MEAVRRRDAGGMAAVYTESAWIFPPDAAARTGREAIRKFWQGMLDLGVTDVMLETVESQSIGESGWESGQADLTRMRSVRVDPTRRTAHAEAGAAWGDFDPETQVFGLATTGGVARPTGIAGLTLAGGHGYLMRKHGLACDNLLSVDIVTADGQLRTASATEHADLFWGVRGGGGNFGIVTKLQPARPS